MVLSLFALLLVLGITFMHSIFGLFSGLIDLLCCLTAMVVTFSFTDMLNDLLTRQELSPTYTLPICFILLFAVTHIALRMAADNLIRGNVRLPMYVDWGGGAVCGFFIGQITVGVLLLGFLMLPFGGRVMMFSRYERATEGAPGPGETVRFSRNTLGFFLQPDEFTVGLFNMLSNGSLKSSLAFNQVYPEYSDWVFNTGNAVQDESPTSPYRDSKGDGWADKGATVLSWWWEKDPIEVRYRWKLPTRVQPLDDVNNDKVFVPVMYPPRTSGTRLLGVRLKLSRDTADRDEGSFMHRFRATNFRLVGDLNGQPHDYVARVLGGADPGTDHLRLADPDNNFAVPATGDVTLDTYYDVDEAFRPQFVEYRRFARAALQSKPADAAPIERIFAEGRGTGGSGPRVIGFANFVDAIIEDGTGDKPELPFAMSRTEMGSDVEVASGRFQSGRVSGFVDQLKGSGPGSISEIAPPEGQRVFQLRCKARQARTLAGGVFNYVGSVINQYQARDEAGKDYPLAGYYGVVKRDGRDYIELFLASKDELSSGGYRSMLDFKRLDRPRLSDPESIIGLLFFVDPGVRIKSVKNQGGHGIEFDGYGIQGNKKP